MRHQLHRAASAAYGVALVAVLLWANRSSGTNLAWIGVLGAVLLLRRGGDFTAELVGFSLAGSVAMGSICGIWLSKAVRIARLTRAPGPLRSPRLVRNSDSRRRPR